MVEIIVALVLIIVISSISMGINFWAMIAGWGLTPESWVLIIVISSISMGMNFWVMVAGWGLTPESWPIIIGGYVIILVVTLVLQALGQAIKNN